MRSSFCCQVSNIMAKGMSEDWRKGFHFPSTPGGTKLIRAWLALVENPGSTDVIVADSMLENDQLPQEHYKSVTVRPLHSEFNGATDWSGRYAAWVRSHRRRHDFYLQPCGRWLRHLCFHWHSWVAVCSDSKRWRVILDQYRHGEDLEQEFRDLVNPQRTDQAMASMPSLPDSSFI